MEEWELYMSDFVPEDITTIVLEAKKEIVYFYNYSIHFRHSMRILKMNNQFISEEHTLLALLLQTIKILISS